MRPPPTDASDRRIAAVGRIAPRPPLQRRPQPPVSHVHVIPLLRHSPKSKPSKHWRCARRGCHCNSSRTEPQHRRTQVCEVRREAGTFWLHLLFWWMWCCAIAVSRQASPMRTRHVSLLSVDFYHLPSAPRPLTLQRWRGIKNAPSLIGAPSFLGSSQGWSTAGLATRGPLPSPRRSSATTALCFLSASSSFYRKGPSLWFPCVTSLVHTSPLALPV